MRQIQGSSKLELMAAIVLIAVCAAVLLNRLSFYQEVAEKAQVEYTISILKSALRIQMATMMTEGHAGDVTLLEQRNPLDWLKEKPVNQVLGVGETSTGKSASAGWEFDPRDRTLTYRPIHTAHFQADQFGKKQIRLQVELVRDSSKLLLNGNLNSTNNQAAIIGLRLHVEPYSWLQ
ncbi:MAG TPA: hypothetical protein VJ654_05430 [Noviherbaspirillum sp.]|nr:hypothetical protein [Noviherbaspirillum sp.]